MTCDRCGHRQATVKFIEVEEGEKRTRWLCEVCAAEEGVQGPSEPDVPAAGDLTGFLAGDEPDHGPATRPVAPCPVCGGAFDDLEGSGLLGCPGCYQHFRVQLAPVLRRYHRAATHVGKAPRARGPRATLRLEIARLRGQLANAVAAEDFEAAAGLRDEISGLQERLQEASDTPEDTDA